MEKKFYKTCMFFGAILAIILFLLIFGIASTKNAPPDTQFMDMES